MTETQKGPKHPNYFPTISQQYQQRWNLRIRLEHPHCTVEIILLFRRRKILGTSMMRSTISGFGTRLMVSWHGWCLGLLLWSYEVGKRNIKKLETNTPSQREEWARPIQQRTCLQRTGKLKAFLWYIEVSCVAYVRLCTHVPLSPLIRWIPANVCHLELIVLRMAIWKQDLR